MRVRETDAARREGERGYLFITNLSSRLKRVSTPPLSTPHPAPHSRPGPGQPQYYTNDTSAPREARNHEAAQGLKIGSVLTEK